MNFGAETKSNQGSIRPLLLLLLLLSGICCLCIVLASAGASSPLCDDGEESAGAMVGGLMGAPKEVPAENSVEIDEIGQFAVKEHNAKEGTNYTFKKVVSAKTQVVSGTMYHLTLHATPDASEQPKLFEAKVWTKPWESHKTLEHFKAVESSSSVSSDTHEASGLREVSVEDPVIKEAAEHALKGLNSKSNSLVPYELKQILSAQAEASDRETQFQLHIKVGKGTKEEEVKAGLHRTAEGKWTVKNSNIA